MKDKTTQHLAAQTFEIQPFDIRMHWTKAGLDGIHARFCSWLRAQTTPFRFTCWLLPATLDDKIRQINQTSNQVAQRDPARAVLLEEYRRHYELLQDSAKYQRMQCGMAQWSEESPRALAGGMMSAFDTYVTEAQWPALFEGRYRWEATPFWHMAPVGRPGGRPVWAILNSYEFNPSIWDFKMPVDALMCLDFPIALSIDVPYSYSRNEGIEAVERKISEYQSHLVTLRGSTDSRAEQRIRDCRLTLEQMNQGDLLHKVQITIAVAAPDTETLRERVAAVMNETRAWYLLRQEEGELLGRSFGYFAAKHTDEIGLPDTTWVVTSRELALMLAPLGYRKLTSTEGILRGEAIGVSYPVFHNSWQAKEAVHEIWCGQTGRGKTFALNCLLSREYAENGVPFDLLEPMGHGRHVAQAFNLPWYVLSPQRSVLNPQDVMYPKLIDQISHTVRIYETILGRPLTGGQNQNLERGLLGKALEEVYKSFGNFSQITPDVTPTCEEVCDALTGLKSKPHIQHIAQNLADEITGICCGSGLYAQFLNGKTNIDLSRGNRTWIGPRVFSFHEMSDDPILMAVAYTQCLSAIRRDSLADEQPRIIVVDEFFRLIQQMKHQALLPFLIEAYKTFRTKRKKVICVDQEMSVFLKGDARHIFENTPIRMIFSQKNGMNVFKEDEAFRHYNQGHLDLIASLPKYCCLLEIQDVGIWHLYQRPSAGELRRFSNT